MGLSATGCTAYWLGITMGIFPEVTISFTARDLCCEKYLRASKLPLSKAFSMPRMERPSSIIRLMARASGCVGPSER